MKTEADIAAHLGTPACIVYAQAFSTISSVIPAFSKRGDIIVADKAVNYAIRKGIQISRSTVRWYEHNDMNDLQRVLERVTKEQAKKPLTRRFIVTEGIFENVGDVVDLPRIVGSGNGPIVAESELTTLALDRAEATLQVQANTGRNVVVRCLGEDRSWCYGTAKCGCSRSRHDHRFSGWIAVCRGRLLRRVG